MISTARGSLNATMALVSMDMSSPRGAASAMDPSAGSILAALNAAGAGGAAGSVHASVASATALETEFVFSDSSADARVWTTARRVDLEEALARRPTRAGATKLEVVRANIVLWWCGAGGLRVRAEVMGDAREFRQKAALALFRVHVARRFAFSEAENACGCSRRKNTTWPRNIASIPRETETRRSRWKFGVTARSDTRLGIFLLSIGTS